METINKIEYPINIKVGNNTYGFDLYGKIYEKHVDEQRKLTLFIKEVCKHNSVAFTEITLASGLVKDTCNKNCMKAIEDVEILLEIYNITNKISICDRVNKLITTHESKRKSIQEFHTC